MKDDFDDFLNASGDEEDEQLEKTTRPARRGGSPSYRGGEGGGGGLSFGSSKLPNLQNTWFSQVARPHLALGATLVGEWGEVPGFDFSMGKQGTGRKPFR